jgi:hypothetical protein
MQCWFNVCKSIDAIQHISRIKDKNHMIILIGAEKVLAKIQHPFTIKALKKSRNRKNIPQYSKVIYDKPIANIILNREKLNHFLFS